MRFLNGKESRSVTDRSQKDSKEILFQKFLYVTREDI